MINRPPHKMKRVLVLHEKESKSGVVWWVQVEYICVCGVPRKPVAGTMTEDGGRQHCRHLTAVIEPAAASKGAAQGTAVSLPVIVCFVWTFWKLLRAVGRLVSKSGRSPTSAQGRRTLPAFLSFLCTHTAAKCRRGGAPRPEKGARVTAAASRRRRRGPPPARTPRACRPPPRRARRRRPQRSCRRRRG